MKIAVILIILACGCANSAYSQINQSHKRNLTSNRLFRFGFRTDSSFTYGGMIMRNDFYKHNTIKLFSSDDTRQTSMRAGTNSDPYHMPCYKPDGVYPMTVFKPDTTTTYTILLRRF